MKTTQSEDTEQNKSLIEIFNTIFLNSSTHIYLDSYVNKNLTHEVIQLLRKERPELKNIPREIIIRDLLEEFQVQLRENISVAFVIEMIEEIDHEIDELKLQNNDNTNSLKTQISEIKDELNRLRGLEDRVTDRVRGSLTNQLSKIDGLDISVKDLKERIPIGLLGRKEFWAGIISAIGTFTFAWFMLEASIDRVNTSLLETIKMNHLNGQETVKTRIDSLEKEIIKFDEKIDQILQRDRK